MPKKDNKGVALARLEALVQGSARTGLPVGLKKGKIQTARPQRARPSLRKGKKGARVELVREVVREAAGFAPYERRVMELIKMATAPAFKRALKFSKARLGTHRRGKKKREEMQAAIQFMKTKK